MTEFSFWGELSL